uniref:Bladder cancer-associated protein n=1 Tax=Sarcoptes scabiei TaxID=52283 RepID=A0A834R288_SARSC
MYCLQWLIPVLLIPKPTNSFHLQNHIMFVILYMISCFLERKTCHRNFNGNDFQKSRSYDNVARKTKFLKLHHLSSSKLSHHC